MDKAKVGWFWTLDGGRPYEDLKSVAALCVVMPAYSLYVEIYVLMAGAG